MKSPIPTLPIPTPASVQRSFCVGFAPQKLLIRSLTNAGRHDRNRNIEHVEVIHLDDPVQVHADEVLAWGRAPMSNDDRLYMRNRQRFAE